MCAGPLTTSFRGLWVSGLLPPGNGGTNEGAATQKPTVRLRGGDPKKADLRKEDLLKQLGCEGKGPWRRGATDFLQVVAATSCATLNSQLGFLVFSRRRQLDFSLRVWGALQSSPARTLKIFCLQQSLQRCYEFTVPQVPGSRRTARAPAECPRVRCLSLCPARILAVPPIVRSISSPVRWYAVLGSRVHLVGLLELRNRLRSVAGREDMMAMAVVPCRLVAVLGNFLVWFQVVVQGVF